MLIANGGALATETTVHLPDPRRSKAEKVQVIGYTSSFGIQIYRTASEMSQEDPEIIQGRREPYADVLSMLLRSMQQARYSDITIATMEAYCWVLYPLPVPSVGIRTLMVHPNGARIRKIPKVTEHFEQVLQTLPMNPLVRNAELLMRKRSRSHEEGWINGRLCWRRIRCCGFQWWKFGLFIGVAKYSWRAWSILPIFLNSTILMNVI